MLVPVSELRIFQGIMKPSRAGPDGPAFCESSLRRRETEKEACGFKLGSTPAARRVGLDHRELRVEDDQVGDRLRGEHAVPDQPELTRRGGRANRRGVDERRPTRPTSV